MQAGRQDKRARRGTRAKGTERQERQAKRGNRGVDVLASNSII
jgi:hypothetical protein